jgi:hypothetical protein
VAGSDVGYYTLPVILSFDGIEKSVNSKLGKAFGDVGKRSSKALADGTEADLKRATDAYQKLRNKAEDALGKVRVEEEKLKKARAGGKTEQIAAAEERLNKALRDSKSATSAAKDGYTDLTNAQKSLGDGTRGLGGNFGNLGDMAGKAGTALTAAGVVAAGAALAGIAALGAGVVVAARELYDLGQVWDDVADSLAVRTATLGPQLDKLTGAVKNLAPATASSIGDIGNVVGQVSQALRLSGSDLTSVSKSILDLDRITGQQTNIRDLGKVFRGFGVDAGDQVGTLDSLYRASAATGLSVNELLAAVQSAGPAARTMGLDLSQTASLLATFNEAGIDGEKALNSLGIAAKNLAKDGIAPAAGLRDTLTQIEALIAAGDEAGAINLGTKIFGRGYGPVLDAIRSGALDAQSLNDALAAGGVTIDEVAKSTADWSERWQQLKNTLSVALEPLASGVFNTINAKLDQLADWVTNNQSKVIGFFQQVSEFAFSSAKSIVQFGADALRTLGELVKNFADGLAELGGVIQFIPGLTGLGNALQDLDDNSGGIQDKFNKAADAMERNLLPALDKGAEYTQAFLERTRQATRFTEVLGEAVATINNNGDIVLTDNTPEVTAKLDALGITVTQMPDGKFKVEANTEDGKLALDAFRAQQEKTPIEVDANTRKADTALSSLFEQYGTLSVGVQLGNSAGSGLLSGPGFGGFGGLAALTSGTRPGNVSEAGLQPQSVAALRAIQGQFPNIPLTSAKSGRENDPFEWHPDGRGLDLGIPNWNTPEGKAVGDQVNAWILQNKERLGVHGTLWQVKDHYNHIHVSVKDQPSPLLLDLQSQMGPVGAAAPMPAASTPPTSSTSSAAMPSVSTAATPSVPVPAMPSIPAIDSAARGSASVDLSRIYTTPIGPSTPGVNEDGEAGMFVPDPKQVREADQRVADAQESILAADASAAQARASLAELDSTASASQRLSAEESVRAAEARAQKARREAADAATDLAEARKGKFTKAKDAEKGQGAGAQSGTGGGLGEIGSIASSFLTETFGLPDLSAFMPLQMMNTVLGAFDWSTMGMSPEAQAAKAAAQGTSSGAFGIPDIAAPPMPTGGMHAGAGGAPGPSQIVNVDQSQNFNNSPLGWDPAKTEKERNNNINRAPRLPVGMGAQ